mmetsp:Transcript_2811/g.4247  ORF Transcript_2811/g.4247 Transcript_2811/m.4247 type:complete len:237 (+) Transcript_2811:265-975(+)
MLVDPPPSSMTFSIRVFLFFFTCVCVSFKFLSPLDLHAIQINITHIISESLWQSQIRIVQDLPGLGNETPIGILKPQKLISLENRRGRDQENNHHQTSLFQGSIRRRKLGILQLLHDLIDDRHLPHLINLRHLLIGQFILWIRQQTIIELGQVDRGRARLLPRRGALGGRLDRLLRRDGLVHVQICGAGADFVPHGVVGFAFFFKVLGVLFHHHAARCRSGGVFFVFEGLGCIVEA